MTPVESLQEASRSWEAQILHGDNEEICWVRFENIHNEDSITYKNCLTGSLQTIEFEHQTFSVQTESTKNDGIAKFYFPKHFKNDGEQLSLVKLNNVRRHCQKIEKFLLQSANDLFLINQTEHQIKLKTDAKSFCWEYGNISFDKRKTMKKKMWKDKLKWI